MRTILRFIVLLVLLFCSFSDLRAQGNTSNKGTEFWTVWMDHVNGAGGSTGSQMNLYITGDITTTGTVSVADGSFSTNFTVTANQVTTVAVPSSAFLGSEGKFNKGIHITSAKNIVVYAHIYVSARSGATLVLPVNAMGKDYYSLNYTQKPTTAYSTFCIVATENSTTVEITPTAALTSGKPSGTPFTVTLQKGEVYQGLSTSDLTGTHIKSVSSGTEGCKKIAVYSGSSWVSIGCSTKTSADNLFQQVYPTASWGKNYITAPLAGRNYDVFRIIYSDATAKVQINGTAISSAQLINNFYYEFSSQTTNVITSDKPIQVVQYAVTGGSNINCSTNSETIGDPEMIFLTPIEQGLDHVTLYSTDKQNIVQSYINLIIPTAAVSSFVLDGKSYTSFAPVAGNTAYSYAQIPVASGPAAGTHNISASQPFNAIAYGFGSVESYGYAAGTDLKNLNEFIVLNNPQTNAPQTNGCVGTSYKLQLTIPYQTSSIIWNLKDGSKPDTVKNPVVQSSYTKGSQTLYVYEYTKPTSYATAGDYTVIASIFNPIADDCGSYEDTEFDFTIAETPVAKISTQASTCLGSTTHFDDATDTKGNTIKSWLWDLGDGQTATTASFDHPYAKTGDYTVTLTVTNSSGCSSTSAPTIVHIAPLPVAGFTYSSPDCETRSLIFTDASTTAEGTITSWVWNFGDGSALETKTDNKPVPHTYAAAGTFTVVLKVAGSTGCSNAISKDITVNPLPVVDFTLPDACVKDVSQFISTSTIADHTESEFTYLWNFGDGLATPANNTSTLAIGKHKYPAAGTYNVTLTITSKYGCTVTSAAKAFVVNGDTPVALFKPDPANTYCGSDVAKFIDQSSVNFGKITKIAMIYDLKGHPADTTFYVKGDVLQHQYTKFSSPLTPQQYTVEMLAYSGASCISSPYYQDIQIKYNPDITVAWPAAAICQEGGSITIIPNLNGFIGTAAFSGTGITSAGVFDPVKSGPGTFTISFMFTAENTCTYFDSFDITVNATPTVNAGPAIVVLEGGSVTINATASSNVVSYQWTLANGNKATGLDHDDILKPTASPSADTEYMLTVKTAAGCTRSSTVKVAVLKAPLVPNTFTPNGDGVNDTWQIQYLNTYPNCTVEIFNRYGAKVYSSIGYPIAWDGRYQGADLPTGTYYYIINPKNGRTAMSGSLTIVK